MSEQIEVGGLRVRIEQDSDAQSPDTWDGEQVFLLANHRQFWVPPSRETRRFDLGDEVSQRRNTHWHFPVEAYIHSGVSLALAGCGNFPDRRWDVSTCAVVLVSKTEARLFKSARKLAQSKVDEWNQYLSGDVWGYVVEDEEGNHLESCWGFYGFEYCKEEAVRVATEANKTRDAAACLI